MQFNLVEHMPWVFGAYGVYYGVCVGVLAYFLFTTIYIANWVEDFFLDPFILVPSLFMAGMLAVLFGNPRWDVITSLSWLLFGLVIGFMLFFACRLIWLLSRAFWDSRDERS